MELNKFIAFPEQWNQDCWVSVFKKLPKHDLKSVSLVSKQFYSLSNTVVFNLRITRSEHHYLLLPHLLNRFTSVKSILFDFIDYNVVYTTNQARSIFQIAHSGLRYLEELHFNGQKSLPLPAIKKLGVANMRSLKILHFCHVQFMSDSDLLVIASSLPWLEELDISSKMVNNKVTDKGIAEFAANLPGLLRFKLCNNELISDQSLYCLLSSCPHIAQIGSPSFESLTVKAFLDAICGYPNLMSLKFDYLDYVRTDSNCCYLCFNFCYKFIEDSARILGSIEGANLPLHKLIFNAIHDFTDSHVLSVLEFLHRLRTIALTFCCQLTNATFSLVVQNCPSLTEFEMSGTALGKEPNLLVVSKNYAIKTLILNYNQYLNDETVKGIALSLPNLECLEMKHSSKVTDEGIGYVRNNCPRIKSLKLKVKLETPKVV